MRVDFSLAVISDRLQALTRALDADPVLPGKLLVLGGTPSGIGQPYSVGDLLVTVSLDRPSLSNVLGRVLTLRNPATVLVTATGEVTWARLVNGANQFVADLDVGLPGSNAAVIVTNSATTMMVYAGGEFSLTLAKLQEL